MVHLNGRETDTLLKVARTLLTILLGLSAAVGIAALCGIPWALTNQEVLSRKMAHPGAIETEATFWISILCVLAALMAGLCFAFLRDLRAIVDHFLRGQALDASCARRFGRMGWLALGFQIALIPLNRLAIWFDSAPFEPNIRYGDDGVSFGVLALSFLLFILARGLRYPS